MRKLTRQQKQDIRAIGAKRDEDIGFPRHTRFSIGVEPAKEEARTVRLDSNLIASLRANRGGYQTEAHWLM